MIFLDKKTELEIQNYCISKFPQEACGFVLKTGEVLGVQNIHSQPEKNFHISPIDCLKHEGNIKFVFHSHPDKALKSFSPSKADMESQIGSDVPWILLTANAVKASRAEIFGWQVIRSDFMGKTFIHGIRDCYSLIRDFYFSTKNILLKEIPRENRWWETKEDIYLKSFKEVGFYEIPFDLNKLEVGDLILFRIRPTLCINHGAVYVGNGWMLHHLCGGLSCKEPLQNYKNFAEKIIRYDYNNSPRDIYTDTSKAFKI